MENDNILEVRDLKVWFPIKKGVFGRTVGHVKAVDGVSFDLRRGETLGVVPSIVEETGRTSQYNDRVLTCENLSERKQLMLDESDVFIALPGGVGTLDEVFTVAASYTIGYHHKRVILYNMKGFWDSTIHMLDDLQQRGMVRGKWRDYICVANNLDEIGRFLAEC